MATTLYNPTKLSNGLPEPNQLGLPFAQWRPGQLETVSRILFSDKRFILVEAPTGVGKSGIAVALARLSGLHTNILTSTLQLQDQYLQLGCKTVKGRRNFGCPIEPQLQADEAGCLAGAPCAHKKGLSDDGLSVDESIAPECPYYRQKWEALRHDVVVHSYSYFLNEANHVGGFSDPNGLLICDEGHLIEDELRRFVEVGYWWPKVQVPDHPTGLAGSWEWWQDYASQAYPAVSSQLARLRKSIYHDPGNLVLARECKKVQAHERALSQLRWIDKSWVVEQVQNSGGKGGHSGHTSSKFRPSWVAHQAQAHLWRHASKVVMMSATILDPDMFCQMLGLDPEEVDFIQLPSPFRLDHRPLLYRPAMRVTSKAESLQPLVEAVDQCLTENPNVKGLVHTHNYKIAKAILADSQYKGRMVSHADSRDRDQSLSTFRSSGQPLVLVSPSMGTGVDLPYDLVRFQIIAKLPFPDRGDQQVQRRLTVGPDGSDDPTVGERWYSWATACSLIQSYGRAMRAADDFGLTYLLDGSWGWWFRQHKDLIPEWVQEAILS